MGIYFYPRGGSAHVCRSIARELGANDLEVTLLSGSRPDLGGDAVGRELLRGRRPAGRLHAGAASGDPLGYAGPRHRPDARSFEDRPGAPDRVFASSTTSDFERQVEAWSASRWRRAGARGRRPLPAPPHPAQRGGGAAAARGAGGRPRPRHRAADAGADRGGPPRRLGARRGLGRAAAPLGGRLRPDRRQRPQGAASAPPPARARRGPLRLRPQRVRPPIFSPAAVDRARALAPAPGRRAARLAPGRRRPAASPTTTATSRRCEGVVLLSVGRFTEVKRLPLLIEAFAGARRPSSTSRRRWS